jgi:hypothetical protein
MVVAELDEVAYDLEIDGEQVRRQLHRQVWEQHGWATVAIVYQERDREGGWKPARLALIRLQRVREAWKKHAAITLDGDAALALAGSIESWRSAFAAE